MPWVRAVLPSAHLRADLPFRDEAPAPRLQVKKVYQTACRKNCPLYGHSESGAKKYQANADSLSAAVNKAYWDPARGGVLDTLQTHQVMPLASGVVPVTEQATSMASLEHAIKVLQNGHLDTGLTGTYFMTKLLTESGRNDLIFTYVNQTTFPSYGYFLAQGYTTWPESWNLKPGVSKMHGCYNAIGLWFIEGIVGIAVDTSNERFPLTIRAVTSARASRSRACRRLTASNTWCSLCSPANTPSPPHGDTAARLLPPRRGALPPPTSPPLASALPASGG
jgi:hypothetical protein